MRIIKFHKYFSLHIGARIPMSMHGRVLHRAHPFFEVTPVSRILLVVSCDTVKVNDFCINSLYLYQLNTVLQKSKIAIVSQISSEI